MRAGTWRFQHRLLLLSAEARQPPALEEGKREGERCSLCSCSNPCHWLLHSARISRASGSEGSPGSPRAEGVLAGPFPTGEQEMEALTDATFLATKIKNTLCQYHRIEDDKWRIAKKTKNVTVWRKPSDEFNGYLYKAQGVMEDVTNNIIDYIRPGPYRLDWDSLMTSMDIVEQSEENYCVVRYTTAGQLWNLIAPREFVDFSYTTQYEDGLLSCGVSVDYEEVRPDFVRGYNHPCGWFCVPLKDSLDQSLLTGYIQTDVRGRLPQSAVDTAMASTLVTFFDDLRKALKA